MEPVLTKKDFVRRYESGEFGNRSPTWSGFQDWALAHLGGDKLKLFHIRNRIVGAQTWYDIPKFEMADKWAEATKLFSPSDLYISEMAPTDRTVIQGEVQQSCRHLDLYYSVVKKPMRQSLIEGGRQVYGLQAKTILEYYLDTPSLEHVNYLLNAYPNHVIEFSTYAIAWGTIPNRKTVIWEVRSGY